MVRRFLSMLFHRLFFTVMYRRGRTPWDTGVSPPELVETVEGAGAMPPGRALDLGCGTGTNSIFLAQHGWQTVGVDITAPAIARAREKARKAGQMSGAVRFIRGDVTRLERLPIGAPCSLLLDLGCLHGLPEDRRADYAAGVAHFAAPGALYLLYGFEPREMGMRRVGFTRDDVAFLFRGNFRLEKVEKGANRDGAPSAWYWLRRVERV